MTDHNDDKKKKSTTRRNALALLGVGAVGGATASSAFSELTADRPIDVEVVDDENAVIGVSVDDDANELTFTNRSGDDIDVIVDPDDDDITLESGEATSQEDGTFLIEDLGEEDETLEFDSDESEVTFDIDAFSDAGGFGVQLSRVLNFGTIFDQFDHYWPMDEGQGEVAEDNNGDVDNNITGDWIDTSPDFGEFATTYAGDGDHFETEEIDDITSGEFTFYMWLRPESADEDFVRIVMTTDADTRTPDDGWDLFIEDEGQVNPRLLYRNDGDIVLDTDFLDPLTFDEWHFIAIQGESDSATLYHWDTNELALLLGVNPAS